LYSPTNPIAQLLLTVSPIPTLRLPVLPIMYSHSGRPFVDPGEGVLFSPGNPEGPLCPRHMTSGTMPDSRATQTAR
jgi:hypothetical protein